jgi:hypothetical protein
LALCKAAHNAELFEQPFTLHRTTRRMSLHRMASDPVMSRPKINVCIS